MTERVAARLAEAGLVAAFIGVESTHAPTLKWFGRNTSLAQSLAAVERFQRQGVKVEVGLILFHPHATAETIKQDLLALRQMDCADLTNFFDDLAIYDGTPILAELQREGLTSGRRNSRGLYPYVILDAKAGLIRRVFLPVFSFARRSNSLFPNPPARIAASTEPLRRKWRTQLLDLADEIVREAIGLTPTEFEGRADAIATAYGARVAALDSDYASKLGQQTKTSP